MGTFMLLMGIGIAIWIYREPMSKKIEEEGLQNSLEEWSQKGIDYAKKNPNEFMMGLGLLLVADVAEDIDDIADATDS